MIRKMSANDTDHWWCLSWRCISDPNDHLKCNMACQLMTNELKNPFFLFACLTEYGGKSKQQSTKKLQIQGCFSSSFCKKNICFQCSYIVYAFVDDLNPALLPWSTRWLVILPEFEWRKPMNYQYVIPVILFLTFKLLYSTYTIDHIEILW